MAVVAPEALRLVLDPVDEGHPAGVRILRRPRDQGVAQQDEEGKEPHESGLSLHRLLFLGAELPGAKWRHNGRGRIIDERRTGK